ncbi:MAG TPA: MBL fold metallo-hydrolase, partial [Ramlibacter sp.]|nr:MBL fold metallo-hydrolase [Ramlibacter sp.]
PEGDPMADWMASLDKVQAAVPDDVLVLPAHNDCFRGLHARIEELRSGQHAALDKLRGHLSEPRRVVDVFTALFRRPITQNDTALLQMATGEATACLNYLLRRGEATREMRDGVGWYTVTAKGTAAVGSGV